MEKVVEQALKEFEVCNEAESTIRKTSLEDLKFRAGQQWPDDVINSRKLEQRPCLTINRTVQFVRQVTNDARQNRPSIKVVATEDNDVETAKVFEGLVRHIQVRSNADIAYDTAVDYQVSMGFGYIRVVTDYCDDNTFDQDIKITRVLNPFNVFLDPNAIEADCSDAKYGFVIDEMPRKEFERLYPKSQVSSFKGTDIGDSQKDWLSEDTVRIAEYFKVEEEEFTLVLLADGTSMPKADYEAQGGMPEAIVRERKSTRRKVMWRKISAFEVLEEREWPGKHIPIIPVLGEELIVDGKRQLIGLVRYIKDSQRMYNYWQTAQTEAIALAPKSPFIIAAGQLEGYKSLWANANRSTTAYLPYKETTLEGNLLPPPQRQQAEPPVQAMVQAIAQAGEDMKATTGIYDAGLGSRGNETSGKAIMARQREGDTATFHFIDNLSRSIRHLGVILVDLIPKIYDAPRAARILGEDGEARVVALNEIFIDKKDGKPKMYDLSKGKYDVDVVVGPSFTTKRQETVENLSALVQNNPEIFKPISDLYFKMQDFPGADVMAERFKKLLPPELADTEGKPQLPPEVQAQMQQAQQMIDALTEKVNELQGEKDMKLSELESKERIAGMNNQTKLAIETVKTEMNGNIQILLAEMKQIQDRLNILGNNQPIDTSNGMQNTLPNNSGGEPLAY